MVFDIKQLGFGSRGMGNRTTKIGFPQGSLLGPLFLNVVFGLKNESFLQAAIKCAGISLRVRSS